MSTRLSTEEPAVWRYRDVKDGKAARWTYSYGEPRHLPRLGFGRTWEVQPLYTSSPVADEVSEPAARGALRDLTARMDFHGIHQEWNELAAARAVLSENRLPKEGE